MRASREEAARSRATIVDVAGRKFREHGYDGIGIASLMEAAGRTHGGFYKQFADKETLIAEATIHALADNRTQWSAVVAEATGDPAAALRDWYLSSLHLDQRAKGCAYAALAAEAPRHADTVRDAFEQGIEESIALLAGDPAGRTGAIRAISEMVGTLILARAVRTPELAAEILRSGVAGAQPGNAAPEAEG